MERIKLMPIARVMNMPDGSTPVPQMGGGDREGTLARSILWQHAGTGAMHRDLARHLTFGSTTTGIANAVAPLNAMALAELEEVTRAEDSAKAELKEARGEEQDEEVEEWLQQNRALTAPPEEPEPDPPPTPRRRSPRR